MLLENPTRLDAAETAQLRRLVAQAPAYSRAPMWVADRQIGSIDERLVEVLAQSMEPDASDKLVPCPQGIPGWQLLGDVTSGLAQMAHQIYARGWAPRFSAEPLAVCAPDGSVVGGVERAAARVLGIASRAVHLVGRSDDGRIWVQQRSPHKAQDPGMWDTLVGGTISADETEQSALERETLEESGIRISNLCDLQQHGWVGVSRPCPIAPAYGYFRERVLCVSAIIPRSIVPSNLDGEVARFALLTTTELCDWIRQGRLTPESAFIHASVLNLAMPSIHEDRLQHLQPH